MREYINIVNGLYEPESKTLAESLQTATDFEIDLILESMEDPELFELNRKLMEFNSPSSQDVGLMTKIGAKIFGQQWAAEREGAMQAMDDYNKFMNDWAKYSKRFNLPLTVENLKEFLKSKYKMGDETYELATTKVQPETDRATGTIENIDEFIPALAFAYFYRVGDQIEKRAEEKRIDIDALGYDDLPNNETDVKLAPGAADDVAGKSNQPAAGEQPSQSANSMDSKDLSTDQISKKMGNVLSSLHISSDSRQQAMNDAKRGFTQSFSKNSRTLAAIGYAYLKAIGAS